MMFFPCLEVFGADKVSSPDEIAQEKLTAVIVPVGERDPSLVDCKTSKEVGAAKLGESFKVFFVDSPDRNYKPGVKVNDLIVSDFARRYPVLINDRVCISLQLKNKGWKEEGQWYLSSWGEKEIIKALEAARRDVLKKVSNLKSDECFLLTSPVDDYMGYWSNNQLYLVPLVNDIDHFKAGTAYRAEEIFNHIY
jgi:hypothetical protein